MREFPLNTRKPEKKVFAHVLERESGKSKPKTNQNSEEWRSLERIANEKYVGKNFSRCTNRSAASSIKKTKFFYISIYLSSMDFFCVCNFYDVTILYSESCPATELENGISFPTDLLLVDLCFVSSKFKYFMVQMLLCLFPDFRIFFPQGITLKLNEQGRCIVARIMHGGMIHRQGLFP